MERRWLPYVVWVVVGVVWSTTWVVIRAGVEDLPPFTYAATRTVLAAATLLVLAQVFHGSRRPPAGELRFWALIGLPQLGVPYAIIFWAEQSISAGLTAILFATFPTFTVLLSHALLEHERLTARKLGGTLLAIGAVGLVVGPDWGGAWDAAVPSVAVLVAAGSSALGAVLVRRHGRTTSTLWLTAMQVASGGAMLTVLALLFERDRSVVITPFAVWSVLYLAWVITVGCYLGLFWLLKRLDATFVSMGTILETALAVLLGVWWLGETAGVRLVLGLALVGASVWLVAIPARRGIPGGGSVAPPPDLP